MANNSINSIFKNGGQGIAELEGANHIQGIFYDLLGCLGGGDNPNLPKDFRQKPMTGFCEILDAFNETIKLRSTGSATVCEVRSSNLKQTISGNQVFATSSGDTLESYEPKESDSQFSTKSVEIRSSDSTNSLRTPSPEQVQIQEHYLEDQTYVETELDNYYQDTFDAPERLPAESSTQEKDKYEKDYNEYEDLNNNNNNEVVVNECILKEDNETPEYYDPDHVGEIGPPLHIPQISSTILSISQNEPELYDAIQKEMSKYSEEIKEIERILKANISSQRSPFVKQNQSQPMRHSIPLFDDGESLADGFMTPTSALEAMHDAASVGSSHFTPSAYLSTYQSCTSFTSGNGGRHHNADGIERTPSFYMDCLNLEEEGNDDHFLKALESVNPSFVCTGSQPIDPVYEPLIIVEGNLTDQGDTVSYQQNDEESKQGKIENEGFANCDGAQEDFHDATDSLPSTATSSKKQKRKKKRAIATASSEGERLWSSASPSEFDDLD
ncbi:hypothetical protein Ocin01_10917 [Orchesella cincta]|uniref:Uncharacterized protein n=1 Tax=Orchesella cincta TaxID=48709 RepID=A0A1D2MRP5_ORCCI|nr:hypothetical protein Ocin01_10917 [Orchesella cincta]